MSTMTSERMRQIRTAMRELNETNVAVRARQPDDPEQPDLAVLVARPVVTPIAPPPPMATPVEPVGPRRSLVGPVIQVVLGLSLAGLCVLATAASEHAARTKGQRHYKSFEKGATAGAGLALLGAIRVVARLVRR